jgi:hypothetical protein
MSTLLGPATGYVDILDAHLAKKSEAEASQPRRYNPLRPSSAGKCAHELATEYAQYKGLLPTNSEILEPELQRIFALGHSIEWLLIKQMQEVPEFSIRYKQQVVRFMKLSDGTHLEGSLDLSIFVNNEGGICDVKSKKDRPSNFGASGWDEADEGYAKMKSVERVTDCLFWINDLDAFLEELNDPWLPTNFLQLNIYANTEFIRESGITHCSLFYFNKNDCRLREMRFRPSETVFAKTTAKFARVHDLVSQATKENIGQAVDGARCKVSSNCRYCWPDESRKVYFATLKPKVWPKDTSYLGKTGQELERLFAEYEEGMLIEAATNQVGDQISRIMIDIEEDKVRLPNGNVYENKYLKSPKPHHEIRRSK